MRLRNPARSRGGRSFTASQMARLSTSSSNSVRSASTRRAATVRLLITKLVRSVSAAATARSIKARSSGVVRTSMRSLRVRFGAAVTSGAFLRVRPLYGRCCSCQPSQTPRLQSKQQPVMVPPLWVDQTRPRTDLVTLGEVGCHSRSTKRVRGREPLIWARVCSADEAAAVPIDGG